MAEDADFIQMFIDEAKIAGQLNHANICQIFRTRQNRRQPLHRDGIHLGQRSAPDQNRFRRLKKHMPVQMSAFVMGKGL